MRMRLIGLVAPVAILLIALSAARAEADSSIGRAGSTYAARLYRCANDYSQYELDAMIANGDDGYEPDDCPLLAHVLTGPMLLNFCQPGDEEWIKFKAQAHIIYQICAEPQPNYPTEPHLDLLDSDGTTLSAQNDHAFGNSAEIWWWNSDADRFVYLRATELGGRHDSGNSAYTVSLHSFTENPYPQAAQQATGIPTSTATPQPTDTPIPAPGLGN